jgi:hypothetical protein
MCVLGIKVLFQPGERGVPWPWRHSALFAASLMVFSKQPEDFQLLQYKEFVKDSNDEVDASGELELF